MRVLYRVILHQASATIFECVQMNEQTDRQMDEQREERSNEGMKTYCI